MQVSRTNLETSNCVPVACNSFPCLSFSAPFSFKYLFPQFQVSSYLPLSSLVDISYSQWRQLLQHRPITTTLVVTTIGIEKHLNQNLILLLNQSLTQQELFVWVIQMIRIMKCCIMAHHYQKGRKCWLWGRPWMTWIWRCWRGKKLMWFFWAMQRYVKTSRDKSIFLHVSLETKLITIKFLTITNCCSYLRIKGKRTIGKTYWRNTLYWMDPFEIRWNWLRNITCPISM